MKEKTQQILKYATQSMFMLYLLVFVLGTLFLNHKESSWHAYAASLSRLQPSYRELMLFAEGKTMLNYKELQAYRLFFSQLLRVLHDRPDGYAMLGFCEYHLGNTDKAITAYKKAADGAPYFIWFNYNVGLIYFQNKDYDHATKYLTRAVRSDAEAVLKFILASKVYMDALASIPGFQDHIGERLKNGIRDSYKMLVISYFKRQRFNELVVVADVVVNQKLDDDGFFYYYLGVGAFYSQQYERAALYLREALNRNPQSAEAYYYLALTLKSLKKDELAIPALQKAEVLAKTRGPSYETVQDLKLRIF